MRHIATDVACSLVCVSVCWVHRWALPKRMNRPRCRLGDRLAWAEGTMYAYLTGSTLTPHGEYNWTTHAQGRCGLISDYSASLPTCYYYSHLIWRSVGRRRPDINWSDQFWRRLNAAAATSTTYAYVRPYDKEIAFAAISIPRRCHSRQLASNIAWQSHKAGSRRPSFTSVRSLDASWSCRRVCTLERTVQLGDNGSC